MSLPRFLVAHLPSGGTLALDEAEARHAASVLRVRKGDEISLFNGKGEEAVAQVETVAKRSVTVTILNHVTVDRELNCPLTLIVALPKGDRQKTLVDGLVQLGVTCLVPLLTEHGVAHPTVNSLGRLRRAVVESSKQCRRNVLMCIEDAVSIADICQQKEGDKLFAHPYSESQQMGEIGADCTTAGRRIAIGPEGGFSNQEIEQLLDAEWKQISMGPRILRIETAAIFAASWHALSCRQ